MGDTSIEWTDATWNPVRGCRPVSEGCRNCFAQRMAARMCGPGRPYEGLVKLGGKGGPKWTGRARFVPEKLDEPLHWRKPRRIFVNSMSDLFHADIPAEDIARVWAVMAACPHHLFQVLTKRTQRMASELGSERFREMVEAEFDIRTLGDPLETWPLPNVMVGTSIENQKTADDRVPPLLETLAALRFVSAEPLLGHIYLRDEWLHGRFDYCPEDKPQSDDHPDPGESGCMGCPGWGYECGAVRGPSLDLVIAGGESGPGARPMHPDWARRLRNDCDEAGVPFFFKGWGDWAPSWGGGDHLVYADGGVVEENHNHPDAWREKIAEPMWRVGKKTAGRELDGRTHDAFPEVP